MGDRLFQFLDFFLIIGNDDFRIVADHVERALGHHNDIPVSRGDPGHEQLALFLDKITFVGNQHFGVGIELRNELFVLDKRGILNYHQSFRGEFQPFEFHGCRDDDRGFACAYAVGKQTVFFDAAGNGPLLIFSQNEFFPVHILRRARVNIEVLQIILTNDMGVEFVIVDLLHQQRGFRILHHEGIELVPKLLLDMVRGERRLLVDDDLDLTILPDGFRDGDFPEVQGSFKNIDGIPFFDFVTGDGISGAGIDFNLPRVKQGIVSDIGIALQELLEPALNDQRGNPDRPQPEIDILNVQVFRLDFRQRFHIGL